MAPRSKIAASDPAPAPRDRAALSVFERLSFLDAKQLLKRSLPPNVAANRAFVEGDHWQKGAGWVGPRLDATTADAMSRELSTRLTSQAFVSRNVIGEVTDRHNRALLGKLPLWTWAPIRPVTEDAPITEDEARDIADLAAACTEWWTAQLMHDRLKELGRNLLFAERASWRLYTPSGLLGDNGVINAKPDDLADGLRFVALDVPRPEDAAVITDPATGRKCGVYFSRTVDLAGRPTGEELIELTYLVDGPGDGPPLTAIRQLTNATPGEAPVNDFGGHLTQCQVTRPTFITAQLRSQQRALNLALTLLEKGTTENHFLERIFLNAQMPGEWEENDQGERVRFKPAPYVTGGQVTNFVQGVDYEDQAGNTVLTNPSVTFRPPGDQSAVRQDADYWREQMLGEAHQEHVLSIAATTASGEFLSQARADFSTSTDDSRAALESAGREVLVTGVAMAESFSGTPGRYTTRYKPVFQCRPNYGPQTVAERQQNVAESEKGLRARETAMTMNGIDDPDAEAATIEAQPDARLGLSKTEAEVVGLWASTGLGIKAAMIAAGIDDERITVILAANVVETEEDDDTPPEGE